MPITIKDIAKAAGVSYVTVSRALRDHDAINIDTRRRIKKIAEEMHYTPNAIARGLVQNKTKMIALLVQDITNPFYPEVALGVEECARKNGYCVLLCNSGYSNETEAEYLKALSERRVDGIIISPLSERTQETISANGVYGKNCPVVNICNKINDDSASFVVIDDFKATYIATEYLVKQGHEQITFIGGDIKSISQINNIRGYEQVMNEHGLEINVENVMGSSLKRESSHKVILELIRGRRLPTAIITDADIIAIGIMEALKTHGYEVPGDVSVIGIDDIEYASLPHINLTTVAQPKFDIGYIAAEILLNLIQGVECDRQVILEPFLIVRGTCKHR